MPAEHHFRDATKKIPMTFRTRYLRLARDGKLRTATMAAKALGTHAPRNVSAALRALQAALAAEGAPIKLRRLTMAGRAHVAVWALAGFCANSDWDDASCEAAAAAAKDAADYLIAGLQRS